MVFAILSCFSCFNWQFYMFVLLLVLHFFPFPLLLSLPHLPGAASRFVTCTERAGAFGILPVLQIFYGYS